MEGLAHHNIRVNNEDDDSHHHDTAFIDSTVQEKNITYPTDAKLHKKIVKKNLRDTAGIQCLAKMGFLREDYTKRLTAFEEEGVSLNYDTPSQRVFQLLFYT